MSEIYIVTRLLDQHGMFFPGPQTFNHIELRPSDYDSPWEKLAISKSRKYLGFKDPNPDVNMRISTIISAENSENAYMEAERVFDEALDIIDIGNIGLQRYALIDVGYVKRTSDGHIDVVRSRLTSSPYTGFAIIRGEVQPLSLEQMLLGIAGQTELGRQIRRSLHWARKMRWEVNPQLRVLFRWFSMEAILVEHKDDNIVPRILACLGFFKGKISSYIRPDIIHKQQTYLGYARIKERTEGLLDKIRLFRHDSVHGGFRVQDISDEQLQRYDELSSIAFDFVHRLARQGLVFGIETVSEFLDYLGLVFEQLEDRDAICDQLQNNVYPQIISTFR